MQRHLSIGYVPPAEATTGDTQDGQSALSSLSPPPVHLPADSTISNAGVTTAELTATGSEAMTAGEASTARSEAETSSEGGLLTNLLEAIDSAPALPGGLAGSDAAVVTTVTTTGVEMDPLDIEAQRKEQAAITEDTTLSAHDDLFGEGPSLEESPVAAAAVPNSPPPPAASGSPVRQLASINTTAATAAGMRSPTNLVLPPPTPRNTAAGFSQQFFLPGLGPLTSTPTAERGWNGFGSSSLGKRERDEDDSPAEDAKRPKNRGEDDEEEEGDDDDDDESTGPDLMSILRKHNVDVMEDDGGDDDLDHEF